MKNIALWVDKAYIDDELFNRDSRHNRDDCLAAFGFLKEAVTAAGGRCHTHDIYRRERISPDVVLFLDIPAKPVDLLLGDWRTVAKKWVLLQEPPVVHRRNWDLTKHKQFDRLFTWNDDLIDNRKYFRYNYSHLIPQHIEKNISSRRKLCTLIAGNKKSRHPLELYSERIEAIRWFERNHPEEFDLYGIGWAKPSLKLSHMFKPFKAVKILTAPDYPSYRGTVARKQAVLERYEFAICYENISDVPGYITEKIFDCFFAGCIPVYLGASNITKYIPSNCFIDKREFIDYESLYEYMRSLSAADHSRFLCNIEAFLNSDAARLFSRENFARVITNEML